MAEPRTYSRTDIKVAALEARVEAGFDAQNARFDRLEEKIDRVLAQPGVAIVPSQARQHANTAIISTIAATLVAFVKELLK
jgi:hypothetical protein